MTNTSYHIEKVTEEKLLGKIISAEFGLHKGGDGCDADHRGQQAAGLAGVLMDRPGQFQHVLIGHGHGFNFHKHTPVEISGNSVPYGGGKSNM